MYVVVFTKPIALYPYSKSRYLCAYVVGKVNYNQRRLSDNPHIPLQNENIICTSFIVVNVFKDVRKVIMIYGWDILRINTLSILNGNEKIKPLLSNAEAVSLLLIGITALFWNGRLSCLLGKDSW